MNSTNMRIPPAIDKGKSVESCLCSLWNQFNKFTEGNALVDNDTERYACGFPIPEFQRGLVWTREQEVSFIESAWLGLPLGSYNIHEIDFDNELKPNKFSGWLIDGQQRLTTIERYWRDEFPVFGLRWSELTKRERRRFLDIKFQHFVSKISDEDKIRSLYLLMAYGGTAHE